MFSGTGGESIYGSNFQGENTTTSTKIKLYSVACAMLYYLTINIFGLF